MKNEKKNIIDNISDEKEIIATEIDIFSNDFVMSQLYFLHPKWVILWLPHIFEIKDLNIFVKGKGFYSYFFLGYV